MDTKRIAPLDISPDEFKALGHRLIDDIAGFLASLPARPVNPAESPADVRKLLGHSPLPRTGMNAPQLLQETARLLFDHSLFNGHPSFFGYVTASAAPIGSLADLLASAVNPNVGGFQLAPAATEIESQTIRWIAELIGYPSDCGGIMVSGGNMANFVCFLAGRTAKIPWDVRSEGLINHRQLRVYCSAETHAWITKAADLFGLGTNAIRWIPTDDQLRMDVASLRKQVTEDAARGDIPLMAVGTAGSVSTGAIDPLPAIAEICREYNMWFHVDGAYGGLAAALPDVPADLKALQRADSVVVDPHKWLYAPLEAGCVLVRDRQQLKDAFSHHVSYYRFGSQEEDPPTNYFEYGPQNSRGFRALKVWLALRHAGREGYERMISDDIALAREMYRIASGTPELEVFTNALSITTFRYVPYGLRLKGTEREEYLNNLNESLLVRLQNSGEAYLSNAVIRGSFVLRACIVNFRTSMKEIAALPPLVVRLGKELHREMIQQHQL